MEFTPTIVGPGWQGAGFLLYVAALAVTLRRMPWRWLAEPANLNRVGAATVCLFVVWQVRAELDLAPAIHVLGATLFTLAFGWQVAVLSLSLVLAACVAVGDAAWQTFGINGLVSSVTAVTASYLVARGVERWMPRNVFIYIFCSGFFGAVATVTVVSCLTLAIVAASGIVPGTTVLGDYLQYSVLLLFPEAFLTGGLLTLAVVYAPHWLVSYSDARWFGERA
ncbi:MAG: energy-coupling factor ABC transporter permease [Gammaproteobacteria bacterium]